MSLVNKNTLIKLVNSLNENVQQKIAQEFDNGVIFKTNAIVYLVINKRLPRIQTVRNQHSTLIILFLLQYGRQSII